jgi:hypothetical protein
MLTVYYNFFDVVSPLDELDKPVYKLKDYNINRVESVSIDYETLEVEDKFVVGSKVFTLENFNFQDCTNSAIIDYSFERTECKKLNEQIDNTIKFGCFCLTYTDPEEIYILFDKINKNYLQSNIGNLKSKFYIENLKDLLFYKNNIDPTRKEVKELFYNVLSHYQDNKDHILPFIKENLDDCWMRTLLFTNFNYTNLVLVYALVECKKADIKTYNLIVQTVFKNNDLIVDDVVKFVIKLYI